MFTINTREAMLSRHSWIQLSPLKRMFVYTICRHKHFVGRSLLTQLIAIFKVAGSVVYLCLGPCMDYFAFNFLFSSNYNK